MTLNRDSIRNGIVKEKLAEAARLGLTEPLTDAERLASLDACLSRAEPDSDVWIFGYGSLMWNPAFHYAECCPATLYGYHRAFRLWSAVGRGSPDCPGLTLGLDRGGSVRGIAFRIAAESRQEELEVIWAREMVAGSYRPSWVRLYTPAGPVNALTFLIRRDHKRYAGKLPIEVQAAYLAHASGWIGTCAEYLENTVAHLDELGMRDGTMHRLLNAVRRCREGKPCGAWRDGTWRPDHSLAGFRSNEGRSDFGGG